MGESDDEEIQEVLHAAFVLMQGVIDTSLISDDLFLLIYARPSARGSADIAGIRNKPANGSNRSLSRDEIVFGGDSPLLRALLTVMRFDPEIRSAYQIPFSGAILPILQNLMYDVRFVEGDWDTRDSSLLDFGIASCCSLGDVPDCIITGTTESGGSIWLLGEDPSVVVKSLIRISRRINNTTRG